MKLVKKGWRVVEEKRRDLYLFQDDKWENMTHEIIVMDSPARYYLMVKGSGFELNSVLLQSDKRYQRYENEIRLSEENPTP